MSNRVWWKSTHTSTMLALSMLAVCSLALSGCGGGGGGGSTTTTNPGGGSGGTTTNSSTLAVISGKAVDTSGLPVSGASVVIVGTGLGATTATDGTFVVNNVPLSATQLQISSPDTTKYYNYGTYNSQYYQFGTGSGACSIALPKLTAASVATTVLATNIVLYDAGATNPPPPPLTNGCP